MASDLAEVIAAWRKQCSGVAPYGSVVIADSVERITRLLDAAEAAEKTRDAALEEAAKVADTKIHLCGCRCIGDSIRALRRTA